MIVNWKGDELVARMEKAAIAAIDETTVAAAKRAEGTVMNLPEHSAAGHRWYASTSRTESAVAAEPARKLLGGNVGGRFGATKARGGYALMLEQMHPYLRPAADAEFPKLAERIKEQRAKQD